ncbi:hypothetical protein WNJ68_06500 [Klebsiella grimontii]|uniref:hypothetical protein n=1 Tax=Klebsiella grimontii TaxID=2058152 RepID=UPI0031019588
MINNQLTREENVQAVFDLKAGYTLGLADVEILKRVARMALAAMDSEPVAWVMLEDLADKDIVSTPAYPDINDAMEMTHGELEPLYRHAQQPVVPDERDKTVDADDHPLLWRFNEGWNACRAAMLNGGKS